MFAHLTHFGDSAAAYLSPGKIWAKQQSVSNHTVLHWQQPLAKGTGAIQYVLSEQIHLQKLLPFSRKESHDFHSVSVCDLCSLTNSKATHLSFAKPGSDTRAISFSSIGHHTQQKLFFCQLNERSTFVLVCLAFVASQSKTMEKQTESAIQKARWTNAWCLCQSNMVTNMP